VRICLIIKNWEDSMSILWFLIIGAVAGWLAGLLMKGKGFGLLWNIIIGCVGALLGGFLFGVIGISAGGSLIGSLITALVGAIILLYIAKLIKK
jgi:uncharacterized membrane protein YeaQ/YmgE (transglycosylase-associated protein family)